MVVCVFFFWKPYISGISIFWLNQQCGISDGRPASSIPIHRPKFVSFFHYNDFSSICISEKHKKDREISCFIIPGFFCCSYLEPERGWPTIPHYMYMSKQALDL